MSVAGQCADEIESAEQVIQDVAAILKRDNLSWKERSAALRWIIRVGSQMEATLEALESFGYSNGPWAHWDEA